MDELKRLESIERAYLLPREVAPVLGTSPETIRWQAHNDSTALGFPVIVTGSRVRIPRLPFIRFITGEAIK